MELFENVKRLIDGCEYYSDSIYTNAKNFIEFPIISKNDVIYNYDRFFRKSKPIIYNQTSGSNGIPITIPWNYNDYLKSLTTLWRLRRKNGILPSDFQLTCHAVFNIYGKRIDNPCVVLANSLSLSKLCYSNAIMQYYLDMIRKFKPKWIYAQPSFVYYIGSYLAENAPELTKNILYIELVGELLTLDVKEHIEALFPNAIVVNMYGMQEFNGIMYENHGIMQTITENVHVEIINNNGEYCNVGEEGDIVVTGLQNTTFPLIRYNTKDRGKRIVKQGSEGYVITSGRANDILVYNGKEYDGSVFFTVINEYNRHHKIVISRFQVIKRDTTLIFKVYSNGILPKGDVIASDLRRILIDIAQILLTVKVVEVPDENGFVYGQNKIKYFINER